MRRPLAGLVVGAALLSGACSLVGRKPVRPAEPAALAQSDWPEALRSALNFVLVRDFTRADSTMRAFAARYPGTPLSSETVFYRALFRLDPNVEVNAPAEVLREARAGFDAYIAGGPTQPHYGESVLLRRLTGHLDSLHATESAVRAMTSPTAVAPTGVLPGAAAALRDSMRVRDDEITRLRTELDQTKAELDRIRRRLAPPRP